MSEKRKTPSETFLPTILSSGKNPKNPNQPSTDKFFVGKDRNSSEHRLSIWAPIFRIGDASASSTQSPPKSTPASTSTTLLRPRTPQRHSDWVARPRSVARRWRRRRSEDTTPPYPSTELQLFDADEPAPLLWPQSTTVTLLNPIDDALLRCTAAPPRPDLTRLQTRFGSWSNSNWTEN